MDIKGARALVTGGAEGIGRAIAEKLIAKGAMVGIMGRRADLLSATAAEIGALAIPGDVAVEADAVRAVQSVVDAYGGIDILVNNAGFGHFAPLVEMDARRFEEVFATNVRGAMLMAREAAKHFIAQKSGNLINISSTSGLRGGAQSTAYSGSKFALRGMTECWREELAPAQRPRDARQSERGPDRVLLQGRGKAGTIGEEAPGLGDRRCDRRHPRDRRPWIRSRVLGLRHESILGPSTGRTPDRSGALGPASPAAISPRAIPGGSTRGAPPFTLSLPVARLSAAFHADDRAGASRDGVDGWGSPP